MAGRKKKDRNGNLRIPLPFEEALRAAVETPAPKKPAKKKPKKRLKKG